MALVRPWEQGLSAEQWKRARARLRRKERQELARLAPPPADGFQVAKAQAPTPASPPVSLGVDEAHRRDAMRALGRMIRARGEVSPEEVDAQVKTLARDAASAWNSVYTEVVKLRAEGLLDRVRDVSTVSPGLVKRIENKSLLPRDERQVHRVAAANVFSLLQEPGLDDRFHTLVGELLAQTHGLGAGQLREAETKPTHLSPLDEDERAAHALAALLMLDDGRQPRLVLSPELKQLCVERLGLCGGEDVLPLLQKLAANAAGTPLAQAAVDAAARIVDQAHMDIVIGAMEKNSLLQVGGAGTETQSMSTAMAELGHRPVVVVPRSGNMDVSHLPDSGLGEHTLDLPDGKHGYTCRLEHLNGVNTLVLDETPMTGSGSGKLLFGNRDRVYGFADDHQRADFFGNAIIQLSRTLYGSDGPHAIIGGAKEAAMATVYAHHAGFRNTVSAYKVHDHIHHIENPMADWGQMSLSQEPSLAHFTRPEDLKGDVKLAGAAEFYGRMNLVKMALKHADAVIPVSGLYGEMLAQDPAFAGGLHGVYAQAKVQGRMHGRLNPVGGEWNPATNPHLAANFTPEDLGGKAVCKAELQKKYGLLPRKDLKLFVGVSRLDWYQKSMDLTADLIEHAMTVGPKAQFIVCGTGDGAIARRLADLADKYPDHVAFDSLKPELRRKGGAAPMTKGLEEQLIAGADYKLMLSSLEPCGYPDKFAMAMGTGVLTFVSGGPAELQQPWDPQTRTGTGFVEDVDLAFRDGDPGKKQRAFMAGVKMMETACAVSIADAKVLARNAMRRARENNPLRRAAEEVAILRRRLNGRRLS